MSFLNILGLSRKSKGRHNSAAHRTLFAKLLEQRIKQGAELGATLVKESYETASSVLSLLGTKADLLHINEIEATLAGRKNE